MKMVLTMGGKGSSSIHAAVSSQYCDNDRFTEWAVGALRDKKHLTISLSFLTATTRIQYTTSSLASSNTPPSPKIHIPSTHFSK
jgi:hypothetical protein